MGQTENTGRCEGLMHKNGEHNVVNLVHAGSHRLLVCGKSSASALSTIAMGSVYPDKSTRSLQLLAVPKAHPQKFPFSSCKCKLMLNILLLIQ
jgi:hypothetical protein